MWPFRHPGRIGPSLCQSLPLGRSDNQRGWAFGVPDFAPCVACMLFRESCISRALREVEFEAALFACRRDIQSSFRMCFATAEQEYNLEMDSYEDVGSVWFRIHQ